MALDLTGYHRPEHLDCLTARDITEHADLWLLAHLADNRQLVAHLLHTAGDLLTAATQLSRHFLHDGWDATRDTQQGLSEVQRLVVLEIASTCASNATLFVQEAQRRRITRVPAGWDPITTPGTT